MAREMRDCESHCVGVRLHRATSQQLAVLLEACRSDRLTYEPSGGSIDGMTPSGLQRHHWTTALHGPDSFGPAAQAIRTWAMHRGSGLEVAADGPIAVDTNVAISAPLPIGFVDVTCRIVAVVDEPDRYGFAYGTLSVHPEQGEEAFLVVRDGDGTVHFDVDAVSRPIQRLARLVPAVANRLQDTAVRRYLTTMKHLVGE
jgi:uncharacterized protein (UPF0548 family)